MESVVTLPATQTTLIPGGCTSLQQKWFPVASADRICSLPGNLERISGSLHLPLERAVPVSAHRNLGPTNTRDSTEVTFIPHICTQSHYFKNSLYSKQNQQSKATQSSGAPKWIHHRITSTGCPAKDSQGYMRL